MPVQEAIILTRKINLQPLYILAIVILLCLSCNNRHNNNSIAVANVFDAIDSASLFTAGHMAEMDSVFAVAKNPSIEDVANKYLHKIYYYRATKGDYDSTLLYADSAINLLENNRDIEKLNVLYARTLFAKGLAYYRLTNYDEAIRNYTIGKLALAEVKDTCELFAYYESMANILYTQKKFLAAAEFFRLKYLSAENCVYGDFTSFMSTQENIDNTGLCYFNAGVYDSAMYYFNKTLDYINDKGQRFAKDRLPVLELCKAVVYGNQAQILYRNKKYAEAEILFKRSLEGTRTTDKRYTCSTQLALANLYIETRQLVKAGKVINEIPAFIDTTEISLMVDSYYKLTADYYMAIQQPYAAHRALLKAYTVRDSLERRNRQLNQTDVRREFENREQKAINEKLTKENEIQNIYLLVAGIGVVMALTIILLVWFNLKRKSKYVRDLTNLNMEIQEKNQELQLTLNSLEQSHKENNRIVKVVAHDLKNPISAIRTLVHSLLKKNQPDQIKEILELIDSTCLDSIALIKDLLNDKRKLTDVSKELVDLGRLIEQCSELFQGKAEEKNQLLKLQVDHPVILLNRQKIWRVISNIVNNAIKFSPENSEISIRLERKDNSVLLSVHDNGIGIPFALQDKIFSIEPDTARTGTAGEESYGLGLSISKKIIEEHKGKLWFTSEAGKGSVFYVELPFLN
ncbi:tetratricopeptide repeat-containing sensor histidine kinase [Foetidibacter luteolus]|uniref:tetratricopeptide repeat-containing sensor histidine kinase n=1 Tax=Foetidibacter luteolus TaxID=2608880 RepID=UPI00129A9FE0|nr:ATP-binding protein [Foetidibacter luteolus]